MKATIKKFWKSEDKWYWIVIILGGGYIFGHIIVGIILKLMTL